MQTADPAADAVYALMGTLESLCYAEVVAHPYFGWRFDVIVKPDLDRMGPEAAAREVRAVLMERAEAVLDAVDAAGLHLTSYPHFDLSGQIDRFKADSLTGALIEPSRQHMIGLRVRFEVDRPR